MLHSWNDLTPRATGGGAVFQVKRLPLEFRLPSEAEWEYAARGRDNCRDVYRYSGSNDIDAVARYYGRHWDHTQAVAQKASIQMGIYDRSRNVWEWGQDTFACARA